MRAFSDGEDALEVSRGRRGHGGEQGGGRAAVGERVAAVAARTRTSGGDLRLQRAHISENVALFAMQQELGQVFAARQLQRAECLGMC